MYIDEFNCFKERPCGTEGKCGCERCVWWIDDDGLRWWANLFCNRATHSMMALLALVCVVVIIMS